MIIVFEEEYLRDLYEGKKPKDKKRRYQQQIVKKYVRTIDLMMAQTNVQGLTHYEKLHGDKEGLSSVRINDQYHIEFREILQGDETFAEVCSIVDLSNHYK